MQKLLTSAKGADARRQAAEKLVDSLGGALDTVTVLREFLSNLWNEENGQDMVEYSLLLGFFALAGAAVLSAARDETVRIWHSISASIVSAGV